MFNCPHTGVALAVLEKLVARGDDSARSSGWSCISTANGLKFTDFKVRTTSARWASSGITSRYANRPVELPADFDAVRRAVFELDFDIYAGAAKGQVDRVRRDLVAEVVLHAEHVRADAFAAIGEAVAVALQAAVDRTTMVFAVGAVDLTWSGLLTLVRSKRSGSAW